MGCDEYICIMKSKRCRDSHYCDQQAITAGSEEMPIHGSLGIEKHPPNVARAEDVRGAQIQVARLIFLSRITIFVIVLRDIKMSVFKTSRSWMLVQTLVHNSSLMQHAKN